MRRYQVDVAGRTFVVDVTETSTQDFKVSVDGRDFTVTLSSAEDVPEAVITPEMSAPQARDGEGERSGPAVPSAAAFRPIPAHALPPMRPASPRPLAPTAAVADTSGPVKAPMPGTVTAVEVRPGDQVSAGQVVVKLEAMKMVNAIKTPHAGIISEVRVHTGESVGHGHVLVTFEEAH